MTSSRIVMPSEWVAAPWKNGGGITHEIAREGPADAFSWRVSVADVAQAGPFSVFPGVDRLIALIEGDGFSLYGDDGHRATLHTVGDRYAFPGDDRLTCTLIGGHVRDLNVMVDRSRWRIDSARDVYAPGESSLAAGGLLLAFVLDGTADAPGLGRLDRHVLVVSDRDVPLVVEQPLDLLVARLFPS